MKTDEETLRHTLDLASAEINRQQPLLALEHLKTIQDRIHELSGMRLWAEFQIIYAEALSAMNQEAAESEFQEALSRLSRLDPRELVLELRAQEHLAQFLSRRGRLPLARKHYRSAESIAVDLSLKEDADRIQLCMIKIELQISRNPQLASLQNLRKAASQYGSPHTRQLTAWIRYSEQLQQEKNRGLMNAREGEVASVDFFKGLLRLSESDEDTD